jgi:hypothetical protein
MVVVNSIALQPWRKKGARILTLSLGTIGLLVVPLFLLPAPSYCLSQAEQKEALGSLSSVGEVYVNDSAAPGESTIFAGDRLRTGETGNATFTASGKGTLKISSQSDVVFAANYQFTAELRTGTAILHSISGPQGITLRIGNFVLVSSFRQQSATSQIERARDGSYRVSCLDGSLGVLTLDAKSGQFLQAGQSLDISSKQELLTFSPPKGPQSFHSSWLLLGLGGAGAAAAAAELSHGGGKQSVSPSAP